MGVDLAYLVTTAATLMKTPMSTSNVNAPRYKCIYFAPGEIGGMGRAFSRMTRRNRYAEYVTKKVSMPTDHTNRGLVGSGPKRRESAQTRKARDVIARTIACTWRTDFLTLGKLRLTKDEMTTKPAIVDEIPSKLDTASSSGALFDKKRTSAPPCAMQKKAPIQRLIINKYVKGKPSQSSRLLLFLIWKFSHWQLGPPICCKSTETTELS
jgi:hypothetical protein